MTYTSIFPLWPIAPFGAEEDGGDSDAMADNSGSSSREANQQGNSQDSSKPDSKKPEDDEDDPYKGLSSKELKKLLRDAEENGTTAAQELESLRREKQEAEDAKLSENQRKDKTINDLTAENSTLRASLSRQAIINAINNNQKYDWNNAEIVAQQLDSEKVKVDDKGKVTGLEKELARIASDDSLKFLLREKGSGNGNNGNDNGPTGFQPGQGGASSGNGIPENAQELAKLMPALSSRL